jgi:hypothetical protein
MNQALELLKIMAERPLREAWWYQAEAEEFLKNEKENQEETKTTGKHNAEATLPVIG